MGNSRIALLISGLKRLNRKNINLQAPVNYPNEHPYTRITEFKYLTGQKHAKTTVVYEYPKQRAIRIIRCRGKKTQNSIKNTSFLLPV
jgi:UDP-galactopyranose mutase